MLLWMNLRIMGWGSDVSVNNEKSLLKAIQEEFVAYEINNPK